MITAVSSGPVNRHTGIGNCLRFCKLFAVDADYPGFATRKSLQPSVMVSEVPGVAEDNIRLTVA